MPEPVFVAQFEPPESIESRINNRENEDLRLPEWNWCGICCVRMIVLGLGINAPSLFEMYKTAFDRYGVYQDVNGTIVGAYHRALAEYIRSEFKLSAECVRGMTTNDLARIISEGSILIASVSAKIRERKDVPPEKKKRPPDCRLQIRGNA